MSRPAVTRWELGQRTPRGDLAERYAAALDRLAGDLFAASREAFILGGPVDHDTRSHLAVEPSEELRERAGYRHRGIVPRPAA